MSPRLASTVTTPVLLCFAVLLAGCRSYRPHPLDSDAHLAAWRARTPSDQPVREFAERLAASGDDVFGDFDPDDGLDRAEAEVVALVYNPDLRLERLRAGVAAASAEHAGLWRDPEFSLDLLRITESVSDTWFVSPGLALTIPLSGRLAVEEARADAALRAELSRVAEAEWAIRRDLRARWLEWSASTLRVEAQEELLRSVDALVSTAIRLAEAGEMPRTEATLLEIEQKQRIAELRRLRGAAAAAELELRALMGLAPGAPVRLVVALEPSRVEALTSEEELVRRNPTLARLAREYEVAEQALRLEISEQYPDIVLGPLYESDQGQSRIGLSGAIPIPVLNANRQGIAETAAERDLARATWETECERLIGEMAAVRARAAAIEAERGQLLSEVVPLVDRQIEDAGRLLELGEGGGLVLLETLVRAHDVRMDLIGVTLAQAGAQVRLRYLLGPEAPEPPNRTGSSVR